MNRKLYPTVLMLAMFSFIITSCKKDDNFHSIKPIEREIHLKINDFRTGEGLSSLVEQFLVFEEARGVSNKLANGTYQNGDPKIQDVVNSFMQNLGGTSNGWISLVSNIENADSIVNAMISDPGTREIIKNEYTQSGVGVSQGDDGLFYVCHIFINIPD